MKFLILIAAMSALVLAKPKPGTYKETEDFQYSRSSSDDGTKSGFYGAQRGNMGGNYERAHNMDHLAQHQMSGLVRQVDGELGQGAKTRTGSVYTAANSRGIYGSGNYDLNNLQGRNFAEGESIGNSQSHSSLSSSQDSRYAGQSYSGMRSSAGSSSSHSQDARYSGYQTSGYADQRQIDNLQALDTSQGHDRYESNNQADYNIKYHSQFGSRGQSEYNQNSANLHSSSGNDANSQARYITTPVRVVMRPGGRVAIPIAAPTYAVSQDVLSENNEMNSDAEVLNSHVGSTPTNKVKHYEASYSYRKQWEKHHAIPGDVSVVVPTENPFPKNSELYEDAQLLQSANNQLQNANSQTVRSGNTNSNHRAYAKASSSQSRFQAGYNSQQSQSGFDSQHNQAGSNSQQSQSDLSSQQIQSGLSSQQSQLGYNEQQNHLGFNLQQKSASSATSANAYGRSAQTSGMASDLTNAAGDVNSKPKSYHSSYSYHKSWERQGDPYVIKPVGPIYDGQASERLTAASSNSGAYSSHQYGSHSRQAHQRYSADCDDQSHIRVARSYNSEQELEQGENQLEDLGQQVQKKFENLENLGQQQQSKWDNLQDLGQQTQNQWGNLQQLGQETQNQWDNLQQLGQQTQNQWGNLQDLGQQTQDKWNNLENLGQQTQTQWGNLQDLGQQTQDKWNNLENLGQQTQTQWGNLQDLGQQTQVKWNNFEDLGQQTHRDLEQHQNENLEDFSQLSQKDVLTNFEQQANNENETLDVLSQHIQKENPLPNFEQQANNQNENLDVLNQYNQNEHSLTNFEQVTNNQNEKLPNSNNQGQTIGFETQSSIQPIGEINNNWNLFEQNQQNTWYQSNANEDKNIDSYDFMKPISQQTDNREKSTAVNDEQNLFSSNSQFNKFWHQNNEQDVFSYTNNNQFKNSFPPSSVSTSDTGNPLQGLWDKIDSIGGEITATGVNTEDKKLFSPDYSSVYLQNKNVNDVQNVYGSSYTPGGHLDLVNTNIDAQFEEKNLGHNNLFDEQIPDTSTTVLPILLSQYTPTPVENASTSLDHHEQQSIDANQKTNSQDEGRGDIGPEETPMEITKTDKPLKTPQEIETLSLTKEAQIPNEGDVIIQPSLIKNKDENTGNELLLTNISQQENTNDNSQYELFTTAQSRMTTTMPSAEASTTVKSNINVLSEQPTNQPILYVFDLNKNVLVDLQKQIPREQPVENVELPEDVHQQNLEQQYKDLSQLQTSWFPTNTLEKEYDQQNTEQQFEDFHQHENIQDQISLQDFGQQIQSSSPILSDMQNNEEKQRNPSQHHDMIIVSNSNNNEQKIQLSTDSKDTTPNTPQIMEPVNVSHITGVNSEDQNLHGKLKDESLKSGNIPSTIETSSESPGFWKSVGNKFTSAKNKVYSWFSRS